MATQHDDDDDADHEAGVGVNHHAALIHEKQQYWNTHNFNLVNNNIV